MRESLAKTTGRKRPRVVLILEVLEARTMPSTLTVNTFLDTNAVNPLASDSNPVPSPLDSSGNISIRSALEYLNDNDGANDTIIVPAGHYLLTKAGGAAQSDDGALAVADVHGVTIQGAGAASTVIDASTANTAAGPSRVMWIENNSGAVTLQGLTLENGVAPVGTGTPDIGSSDGGGGGILDEAALTVTDCVLTDNTAQGSSSQSGPGAGYGGAIFEDTSSGLLTIVNTTISNNHAFGSGNASGSGSSGGSAFGGGVYDYFSPLSIQSSTFSGNQALGGNGSDFGAGGNGEGGGVYFEADDNTYVVSESTFSGNIAAGGTAGSQGFGGNGLGGGIFSNGTSSSTPSNTISDATIANNQANGGIDGSGSDGVGQGGGVYNDSNEGEGNIPGLVSIGDTIIAQNSVSGASGGGEVVGTTGTDVFDDNVANGSSTGITSLGFNLIGNDDEPTSSFTDPNDQVGTPSAMIDPQFGPLQDNGGPTETLAVPATSPAFDGGGSPVPSTFDQRGVARTLWMTIGAYQDAPASLTLVVGQNGVVGTTFPLSVAVSDASGVEITRDQVPVDFAITDTSGATPSFPDGASGVLTVNGVAQVNVAAGTGPGGYTVTASANGLSTSFDLAIDPGQPAILVAAGGDGQDVTVGTAFTPLQVLVTDAFGNPLAGVAVDFTAPDSDPSASFADGTTSTSVVTDDNGLAEIDVDAGTGAGEYMVTATADGLTTSFDLTNDPGQPAILIAAGGDGQDAAVGTAFAPLQVFVFDAFGNPLANVPVAFAGPGSGATATFPSGASAVTDDNGMAEVNVAAGTVAGEYTVTASVGDLSDTFALTDDPGAAVKLVVTAQSQIDQQDSVNVTVQAFDAFGNIATGFRGTVHFASNDTLAQLPADTSFTAADAGEHTFTGLRLFTPGSDTLFVTASDLTASGVVNVDDVGPAVSLNESLAVVAVNAPLATGGAFTDPDGSSWTATVDYGDGGGSQALSLHSDKTFQLAHTYTAEGNYTITVVVTDQSGVSSSAQLLAEVFLSGTSSSAVGVATASPGTTATASANGITGVLTRDSDDTGAGLLIVASIPTASAQSLSVTTTTANGTVQTVAFDVRGVNLTSKDSAVVTFSFPADGFAPVLQYFDRATGKFQTITGVVDPVAHTITVVFGPNSTPHLTDLTGTVFTVTVSPVSNAVAFAPVDVTFIAPQSSAAPINTVSAGEVAESPLSAAVGLFGVALIGPDDNGGGGLEIVDASTASQKVAQDILNDLPAATSDDAVVPATPSTAVLTPSQATLSNPSPPAPKKKDGPGASRPPLPSPALSPAAPAAVETIALTRSAVVQLSESGEAAPDLYHHGAPPTFDPVLAGAAASLAALGYRPRSSKRRQGKGLPQAR